MNACWVSVLSKFYMQSVMVFLITRKIFNGNIIIVHLKNDAEKVVLLQVKGVMQIIVKFRAGKFCCTFLSCTKNT